MSPQVWQRMTLLTALVAVAGGGTAVDTNLQTRLEELEAAAQSQEHSIRSQHERLAGLEARVKESGSRRLQTVSNSIHGGFDADHVAYSDDMSVKIMISHVWHFVCGALVFFMQAGFAMVEVGTCRSRSMDIIAMKYFTHVCIAAVCWWLCGWAFAYGGPLKTDSASGKLIKKDFIGHEQFVGMDFYEDLGGGRFEPMMQIMPWFQQWAICVVATSIVSGGVGERMTYLGYLVYSVVMAALVYPIVVCSTWGHGWLSNIMDAGFYDQAGSGVVHVCGGTAALIGAVVTGARGEGRVAAQRSDPSNTGLVLLGTFILWFGWYGLNCGSVSMLSLAQAFKAAQVAANTTVSAALAGLTAFSFNFATTYRYDIGVFCSGIAAGLVAISAGVATVPMWGACALGIVAGADYLAFSTLLKRLKVDDPCDRFAVHAIPGIAGIVLAPILDMSFDFASINASGGWDCIRDSTGNCATDAWIQVFLSNLILACAIFAWTVLWSVAVFFPLKILGLTRAPTDVNEASPKAGADNREFSFSPTANNSKPTLHAI